MVSSRNLADIVFSGDVGTARALFRRWTPELLPHKPNTPEQENHFPGYFPEVYRKDHLEDMHILPEIVDIILDPKGDWLRRFLEGNDYEEGVRITMGVTPRELVEEGIKVVVPTTNGGIMEIPYIFIFMQHGPETSPSIQFTVNGIIPFPEGKHIWYYGTSMRTQRLGFRGEFTQALHFMLPEELFPQSNPLAQIPIVYPS